MKLRTVYDDRKLRSLEVSSACSCGGAEGACAPESRAELRARLGEAERLVRRLRADAERQRREVQAAAGRDPAGGAVTNLLFDGVAARHAHVRVAVSPCRTARHYPRATTYDILLYVYLYFSPYPDKQTIEKTNKYSVCDFF